MKLLLTSNGLSNDSIARAFQELIGKEPKDAKVAFIPTAAHGQQERGNKDWLIRDQYKILEQGYYVDIVELTAIKPEKLKYILEPMDAIFVGGGNAFYLSYWIQKTGLFYILPELLKDKVYAGISAGSMIAGDSLTMASGALKNPQAFKDEEYNELGPEGESSGDTLRFVDFLIRPHLNSHHFPMIKKDRLEEKAKEVDAPIYALDDESALKIIDGEVEVVSERDWTLLNKK
jgi:dipeptidase E